MGDDEGDVDFDGEKLVGPTQRSLDAVARQVNSIRICDWELTERELRPRVVLTVDDRKRIDELLRHIEIVETDEFFHCMCIGSLIVQLITAEGVVATLTLHHGKSMRWDDAWDSDARLRDGWGLARWLAQQGVTRLLKEMEQTEERDARSARAFASWHAAMPPCMASLYGPSPIWPPSEAIASILAALKAAYGTESQAILALCEWHGTLGSSWTGCYAFESLPDSLLEEFGRSRVLEALETAALTERQVEGAARYLVHHVESGDIPPRVADVLRAHASTRADAEKIALIRRLLAR